LIYGTEDNEVIMPAISNNFRYYYGSNVFIVIYGLRDDSASQSYKNYRLCKLRSYIMKGPQE
jgi:hypothetical protein